MRVWHCDKPTQHPQQLGMIMRKTEREIPRFRGFVNNNGCAPVLCCGWAQSLLMAGFCVGA
ncbi:MAG: hypothetical protein AT717_00975 [Vulcanisaeta sp. CIS_19]|nr:MAG: hypothetical protein AT717_00975 [Vulcanisaeta sp. CIS_19]